MNLQTDSSFPFLSQVRTKNQGTTMRTMPFPDYLEAPFRDRLNTFYSVCQIFATCQVW